MNKKIIYVLTSLTVLLIIIIIGIEKLNNVKEGTFSAEKLNINSKDYKKINGKVSETINKNGVYLLNIGDEKVEYLILDGSHISFKNEVPYYSDVKVEKKEDSIMIYFNEEEKTYSESKFLELRLIYKITEGKGTEYTKVFKNGEETHFDSVIGA